MNSRCGWEGISSALPGCCSWFANELQIFPQGCSFHPGLVRLVRQLPVQNSKYPISSCFNTTQHKNAVRLWRWEADYRFVKEAMMITVHAHLGRRAFSSVAGAWHCQTSSLGCLTGARLWRVFFCEFHQGQWTGYHALWSHALSPADRDDVCLLSPSHCWQVPLTARWSPGAAVTGNRAPHCRLRLD